MAPRHKNKGKNRITRKKIIKDAARKEFIEQAREAKKLLNQPKEQDTPKQSFGVLDRFVPKPITKK